MILCDIGNTFLHFYQDGRVWKESPQKILRKREDKIFYISVSKKNLEALLNVCPQSINLAPYFLLDTAYRGLGIDRIAACQTISEGVVIDAGSAITIDIMQDNMHLGGYILPGIASYLRLFSNISERLQIMPDLSLDLDLMPQNTKEAISLGILKSIVNFIQEVSKGKTIYFSGGDGKFFSKFFKNSIYNEMLVFNGMQKAMEVYYEKNS